MTRQYGRYAELLITPPGEQTRKITGLRIIFEVTKSVISFPNVARIQIYNPNDDTLAALQKRYTQVILNAGYKGNVRMVYRGQVRNVTQERQGTEQVVTIYSGDAEAAWRNTNINKTYVGTLNTSDIIKDVIGQFKDVAIGVLEGLPDVADKLRGEVLSGSAKDILDKYAAEYNFNWSIQDGVLTTTPTDRPLSSAEAVLITAATGMVGSPTITEIGADVVTLMNPLLAPDGAFVIQSLGASVALGNLQFRDVRRTRAEGTYKVQEITHNGDTRQGSWLSTVKGRLISG